jgi:hypothetical protein
MRCTLGLRLTLHCELTSHTALPFRFVAANRHGETASICRHANNQLPGSMRGHGSAQRRDRTADTRIFRKLNRTPKSPAITEVFAILATLSAVAIQYYVKAFHRPGRRTRIRLSPIDRGHPSRRGVVSPRVNRRPLELAVQRIGAASSRIREIFRPGDQALPMREMARPRSCISSASIDSDGRLPSLNPRARLSAWSAAKLRGGAGPRAIERLHLSASLGPSRDSMSRLVICRAPRNPRLGPRWRQ